MSTPLFIKIEETTTKLVFIVIEMKIGEKLILNSNILLFKVF